MWPSNSLGVMQGTYMYTCEAFQFTIRIRGWGGVCVRVRVW